MSKITDDMAPATPTAVCFCALSIRERCRDAGLVLIDTRSSKTHWGAYVQSVTVSSHLSFRQLLYHDAGYLQLYDQYRHLVNSVNEPRSFNALASFVSSDRLFSAMYCDCLRRKALFMGLGIRLTAKFLGVKVQAHAGI